MLLQWMPLEVRLLPYWLHTRLLLHSVLQTLLHNITYFMVLASTIDLLFCSVL